MTSAEFEQKPEPFEARIGRYRDFTDRHQENGKYNPELGLGGILSTLTPDPKAITLYSMPPGTPFFTARELHKNALNYIESLGLPRRFPISYNAVWEYCYNPASLSQEGSLVSIGSVVRELNDTTAEGEKTAYIVSNAGVDLARPLIVNMAEWVRDTRESSIPHRFDSMWRILSSVSSKTEHRRPLGLFKVVEYLVNNPRFHRRQDLAGAFQGKIDDTVISSILNSLGYAGIIDYESPERDIQGERARGWATRRSDQPIGFQEALEKIREIRGGFHHTGYLQAVINHIEANPDEVYERNELANKLRIGQSNISTILSLLQKIGGLKEESGFKGGEIQSSARANDLTKSLYDRVLFPTQNTAQTLEPLHKKPLTRDLVSVLLENYEEERTRKGPQGGKEVRDILLQLLSQHEQMKVSYLAEQGNNILDRELSRLAWQYQIQVLVKGGEIEKTGRGVYRKK